MHIPRKRSGLSGICSLCLLLWLGPFNASACPICNTETGVQVRQSIFGENFLRHAAWTLAPVPVLLGAVALVHFGFRPRTPKKDH